MKSLDELRDSEDIHQRWLYYFVSGDWKKAEDDEWGEIRREAYGHTGNWKKAEDDKDVNVRLSAFSHTGNWEKAYTEDDHAIRKFAYKILSYKTPTKSIKQQLLDLANSIED